MNTRIFLFAALLLSPLLLAGCSGETPVDNTAMLPDSQRVSNVPWNRPENWEGRSQLGALQNDPRFNGNR